jgi:cytochrome P450
MLFLNPPDHTRIRGLVSRAFTPRRVHALRPRIEAFATECLDRMADLGEFDLLEELGFPLPVAVIGELVGVPRADWGRFRRLVSTGALLLENAITYEQACEAVAANDEMWAYFVDLVDRTRRHPGDDLLSAMLEVADADGDRLTTDELIVSAILMFAAGFETTTNLIGNGVAALCRHPDQLARLRRDPALVPAAVEEILRWDSPVQLDGRSALVDADIAGQAVKAGQRVVTILGAANHDPTHFTDPGRFDVTRDEGPPLSFGSGIHHCLGANLARAEGQVVLAGLLERFDRIEVTAPLVNRQRLTLRGYESVPVRVA